jgi:hypothetical protein
MWKVCIQVRITLLQSCLCETLPLLLEDLLYQTCQSLWSQYDGCCAHYGLVARQLIIGQFPGRWLEHVGPVR